MLPHLGIDMTDMLRGEGEWKNMQDVIRNSFRLSFENLEKQAESVHNMVNICSTLREDFSNKLNESEIKSLLDTREMTSNMTAKKMDLDLVEARLAEMKSDLARKATTKYVDDSLRRKVDRTDALIKNAPPYNAPEIQRIITENKDLRSRMDKMEKLMESMSDMIKLKGNSDEMHTMKIQMNDMIEALRKTPNKADILAITDEYPSKENVMELLNLKSDKAITNANFHKLEQILGEHEKTITKLRLRLAEKGEYIHHNTNINDNNVLGVGLGMSGMNIANNMNSTIKSPLRQRYNQEHVSSQPSINDWPFTNANTNIGTGISFSPPGSPLPRYMRHTETSSSKIGADNNNNTSNNNNNSNSNMRGRQRNRSRSRSPSRSKSPTHHMHHTGVGGDYKSYDPSNRLDYTSYGPYDSQALPSSDGDNPLSLLGGHLKAVQIEAVLNSIWTKVKQLGDDSNNFRSEVGSADRRLALLESQMTNTITNEQLQERSVFESEELTRDRETIQKFMKEVTSFLKLPQKRTLADHMDAVGQCVDTINNRVDAQIATIEGIAARTEDQESHLHLLDARVVLVEELKEKIHSMNSYIDVSHAGYKSIAALGHCVNNILTKIADMDAKERVTEDLFRHLETRIVDNKASSDDQDNTSKYLYTRLEGTELSLAEMKEKLSHYEGLLNSTIINNNSIQQQLLSSTNRISNNNNNNNDNNNNNVMSHPETRDNPTTTTIASPPRTESNRTPAPSTATSVASATIPSMLSETDFDRQVTASSVLSIERRAVERADQRLDLLRQQKEHLKQKLSAKTLAKTQRD